MQCFNNNTDTCYCARIDTTTWSTDDFDSSDCRDDAGAVCVATYIDASSELTDYACNLEEGKHSVQERLTIRLIMTEIALLSATPVLVHGKVEIIFLKHMYKWFANRARLRRYR